MLTSMKKADSNKVWLLTQFFDPEPTFKGVEFASRLKTLGLEVEVITGFPNYPGGKIYSGYALKAFNVEFLNGIRVNRVYIFPSHDRSRLKRAITYLSFCLTALVFLLLNAKKGDRIYVYHPPITVGLAAAIASKIKRSKYVIDVQDLWPHSLSSTGMVTNSGVINFIGMICKFVYSNADVVVAQSNGFKAELTKLGIPECRVQILYNWCDETKKTDPTSIEKMKSNTRESFVLTYCGNLGPAQDMQNILEAFISLKALAPNVKLVIAGDGLDGEKLREFAKQNELSNVEFLGRRPRSEIPGLLEASDCLLVSLRNERLFDITLPSKTQEYMFAGKPILAVGGTELRELVNAAGAGLAVEPGSPERVADAVLELTKKDPQALALYGKSGKKFYDENLSFEIGTARFAEFLQQ